MIHRTHPDFWKHYNSLPLDVRELADKSFMLLKANPNHPSLQFKKLEIYWSARVGAHYRALAVLFPESCVWFWIGTHAEYDRLAR